MSVETPTGLHPKRTISPAMMVLLVAVAILGVVENITISGLPVLQRELGMTVAEAALCASVAGIVATLAYALIGKLGDQFGGTKAMLSAMALVVLGSMVCAVANSTALVALGFVLLGIGGSSIATAISVLRQITEAEGRANATGFFVGAITLGGAVGGTLAGPIADATSRFWMYAAPAAVLALAVIGSIFLLPRQSELSTGRMTFDWKGILAFGTALTALQLAMLWSSTEGWTSPRVLAGFTVMVLGSAIFIVVERRSAAPFIDISMVIRPAMAGSLLIGLATGYSIVVGSFLYQQILVLPAGPGSPGLGYSLTAISLIFAPATVVGIVMASSTGKIIERLGLRSATVIALASLITGTSMMIWWHDQAWQIIISSVMVLGISGCMLYTATIYATEISVPNSDVGIATSLVMTARALGGIIGVPIAAALLLIGSAGDAPAPTNVGLQLNFTLAAAFGVLVLAAVMLIPAKSPESESAANVTL